MQKYLRIDCIYGKNMYLTIGLLIKQVHSDISYNFRYLKGIKRRIESDKSK